MVVIEVKKADSVFVEKIKEIIKKGIEQKIVSSNSEWDKSWSIYGINESCKNKHLGIISWETLFPKNMAFIDYRKTLEIISFYPFFTEMIKKLEPDFEKLNLDFKDFYFKIIIEERF